jgi:hypothetical protein
MISFEIRVNGSLISAINCVNRSIVSMDTERGVICEYEYGSATFPFDMNELPSVKHGKLVHVRRDGALVLARELFARIIEEEKAEAARDETPSDTLARTLQPALRRAGWTLSLGAIAAVIDAANEVSPP